METAELLIEKCGSEQVRLGVLDITCSEPQDMAPEQLLSMLRFEQRGRLAELPDEFVSGRDAYF